jgi:hypothetical protein
MLVARFRQISIKPQAIAHTALQSEVVVGEHVLKIKASITRFPSRFPQLAH